MDRPDQYELCGPIQPDHLAEQISKSVPVGLRQVIEFVDVEIDRASRQFMQMRLPEMGAAAFDERNFGPGVPPQLVTQARDELDGRG